MGSELFCVFVCVVGGVMNNYTSFIHSFIHLLLLLSLTKPVNCKGNSE